jgi:hypothetical protein
MFQIDATQMSTLEAALKRSMPVLCQEFLRREHGAWVASQTQADIDHFCKTTMAFAAHCKLASYASLERLLEQRVLGRMPTQFTAWQKMVLTRQGYTEEMRMTQFLETLSEKEQPVLITLETDLAAIQP